MSLTPRQGPSRARDRQEARVPWPGGSQAQSRVLQGQRLLKGERRPFPATCPQPVLQRPTVQPHPPTEGQTPEVTPAPSSDRLPSPSWGLGLPGEQTPRQPELRRCGAERTAFPRHLAKDLTWGEVSILRHTSNVTHCSSAPPPRMAENPGDAGRGVSSRGS